VKTIDIVRIGTVLSANWVISLEVSPQVGDASIGGEIVKRLAMATIAVTAFAMLGFSAEAGAATANPYVTRGHVTQVPPGKSKSYNFCANDGIGCPYTTWTLGKKHTVTDGFGDQGTYTKKGKTYVFTLGSCVFDGIKTKTGFNSASNPGNYECGDGAFTNTWWATKA
jgi:hypothetical protein